MAMQVTEQGGVVTIKDGSDTVVVIGTVAFNSQKMKPIAVIQSGASDGVSVWLPPKADSEPFIIETGAGQSGIDTFVESIVVPGGPISLTNADLCAAFEKPLRDVVTSPAVRALSELGAKYGCKVVISPSTPNTQSIASVADTKDFAVFHKRW